MELILTTLMMAVVLIVAPVLILKKSVKPKETKKTEYIAYCTDKCIFDVKHSTLRRLNGTTEEVYDHIMQSDDLYTITLIGGGGGGSANSVGGGGEVKNVKMLSLLNNIDNTATSSSNNGILTGYYLMEAGIGGDVSNSGTPAKFCVISEELAQQANFSNLSCDTNGIIIAKAAGGISSNESSDERFRATGQEEIEQLGESIGYGGPNSGKGNNGIVIIK